MKKIITLLSFVCSLTVNAQFSMIDDINPQSFQNGGPFIMTQIPAKGIVVFWAYNPTYGIELWKSNGTPNNATLVKDIIPGATGILSTETYGIVAAYDRAYFVIDDKVHGKELWVTDGTNTGTHIVTDYIPGASGSGATILLTDSIYAIVHASDGTNKGIFKTDGTETGTFKFGGNNLLYPPTFTYKYKSNYYYNSYLSVFRSNGTANSQTSVAASIGINGIGGLGFSLIGDTIYYGINNTTTNAQLVKSRADFTGATVIKNWTQNGQNAGPPHSFFISNEQLYFALPCQYYVVGSYELNQLNIKTNVIQTIDTTLETSLNPHFKWLTTYKNKVYYRAIDKNNKRQLYITDGTKTGTKVFSTDFEGGIVIAPISYKDTLYFIEFEKRKLWKTDGTLVETKMLSGTNEVTIPFYDTYKGYFWNKNDTALLFSGFFKIGSNGNNQAEIWKLIEAKAANPASVNNLQNVPILQLFPNPAIDILNILYNSPIEKAEVYNLSGTLQTTNLNKNALDISNLSKGIYFVKVYSENGVVTQKFIKQ